MLTELNGLPVCVGASENPRESVEGALEYLRGLPETIERNYAIMHLMSVLAHLEGRS